jgi:hypothetical protein
MCEFINKNAKNPLFQYNHQTSNLCMLYDGVALALRYIAALQGRAKRRASRASSRDAKP